MRASLASIVDKAVEMAVQSLGCIEQVDLLGFHSSSRLGDSDGKADELDQTLS